MPTTLQTTLAHFLKITTQADFYIEIKVVCGGYFDQVAIGLSVNSMTVPGYQLNSIGWHGDDGKLYKDGQMFQQLPLYSTGDTIGIGLTRELFLFFVLNDHLILKL